MSAFPSLCDDEGRRHPERQLAHFNPPVRQYQTDVSIKDKPIRKSQLVCWIGGSFSKEDTRNDGPGQEPPILQEAASLRACPSTVHHKRAFLSFFQSTPLSYTALIASTSVPEVSHAHILGLLRVLMSTRRKKDGLWCLEMRSSRDRRRR